MTLHHGDYYIWAEQPELRNVQILLNRRNCGFSTSKREGRLAVGVVRPCVLASSICLLSEGIDQITGWKRQSRQGSPTRKHSY